MVDNSKTEEDIVLMDEIEVSNKPSLENTKSTVWAYFGFSANNRNFVKRNAQKCFVNCVMWIFPTKRILLI